MDLRELRYGIEIETVKRTREQIAWAIHSVVGGHVRHIGAPTCYDPWEVEDLLGRKWKVVNDASLTNVPSNLRAEIVSPVLTYNDLEQLQEVVRAIRRAGGKINKQCGIHIHIDAEPFDGRKLGNLVKVVYKQEPQSAKYNFRVFLLHPGLIGDEFKTACGDYMLGILSRIETEQNLNLPDESEAAAAEFLTILAKYGLMKFLPDDVFIDISSNAQSGHTGW